MGCAEQHKPSQRSNKSIRANSMDTGNQVTHGLLTLALEGNVMSNCVGEQAQLGSACVVSCCTRRTRLSTAASSVKSLSTAPCC